MRASRLFRATRLGGAEVGWAKSQTHVARWFDWLVSRFRAEVGTVVAIAKQRFGL